MAGSYGEEEEFIGVGELVDVGVGPWTVGTVIGITYGVVDGADGGVDATTVAIAAGIVQHPSIHWSKWQLKKSTTTTIRPRLPPTTITANPERQLGSERNVMTPSTTTSSRSINPNSTHAAAAKGSTSGTSRGPMAIASSSIDIFMSV